MLALLLAIQGVPQAAPPLRLHYRVASTSTVDLGTGAAPLVLKMSAFIAITLSDSAAGRFAEVRIYSSTFDGGAMAASLPPQLLADPKDVTLHGYVTNGRLTSLIPSTPNLQAMQLMPVVQLVLTATKSATPGDHWTDSSSIDSTSAAASSHTRSTTAWVVKQVAGGADFEGAISGTMILEAGSQRLDLPISGSSRLATRGDHQASAASQATAGQGELKIGAGSLVMKVRNEVTATLFRTAAWAAIP